MGLSVGASSSCQVLAEEMDAHNERLGWLNKHAPQILTGPSVSSQNRDQHVGKLRAINLSWSKVPTIFYFYYSTVVFQVFLLAERPMQM